MLSRVRGGSERAQYQKKKASRGFTRTFRESPLSTKRGAVGYNSCREGDVV
jgi:hypothetical protein